MLIRIKHYQQLTAGQRYQIEVLYGNSFSQRRIAESIGVHPSTVSRELKRNRSDIGYCAMTANTLKDIRKRTASKYINHHDRHEKIISEGLLMGWSPKKLSLRMKHEVPELALSHMTIYHRIAADKITGGVLYTRLPRFGKQRCRGGKRASGRSLIPNRIDISQRPQEVSRRSRIGDWEGDTVHGKNAYLVTLAERRSRLVLLSKVADKRAETVAQSLLESLSRIGQAHTITLDNGGEFARHEQVAKATGVTIYFAKPYASYQRGTNENINGLIRRYWPKGTDFNRLSDVEVKDMELRLNIMPRVVLGGLTPLEVYTGRNIALIP